MLKTAAVSVLRFQEDSLGTAARRILVDVNAVVIIHRCSVAFLCEFLLHARDEALIPGGGGRGGDVRERRHNSTHFWEATELLNLNQLIEIKFNKIE